MEKTNLPVKTKDTRIIQDAHLPVPPTAEGVWRDKGRDHDYYQKEVSLAAQLGGMSASAGCLTEGAEGARREAEQQHYRAQEIHPEQILKNNK